MGMLDDLVGGALGQVLGGGGSGGGNSMVTKLLPVVLGMLGGKGAAGGLGGLGGLLGKFQSAGLKDEADSWVSTGENRSLSADQVRQALGDEHLDAVAGEAGVSRDEAAGGLADLLPGLIDKLTPGGNVPDQGGLMDQLGALTKMLGH